MDFPLLLSTFFTVFLAELGDKTQLATVAISGTSNRPLAVFLGSSSALVLASLLGAFAGGSVATVIPSDLLQLVASLGFLVIGGRLLVPLLRETEPATDGDQTLSPKVSSEGLTPHGLLNSVGHPSVSPDPDGRFSAHATMKFTVADLLDQLSTEHPLSPTNWPRSSSSATRRTKLRLILPFHHW